MRGRLSLFDLWFYGVVGFIVLTASLALAFAIAITGPPTDEELDGLSAALGRASRDAAVLAQHVGEEACVQLPPEVTTGLCPAAADPEQPTLATEEVAYEPYPVVPERAVESQVDENIPVAPAEDLLGDVERADPRPRAERRTRVEPRRERRRVAEARPRSIQRAEVDLMQPLPSAEAGDVVAMQPAVETEIAPPEGIAEATVYEREELAWEEAEEARYDPYDDGYERERYAGDEAYDEDEYEGRRERRRERRRQRREQYYGGW